MAPKVLKASKTAWVICSLFGFATLMVALAILPLFPTDAATDVSGYGGSVYAFEFARTSADLIALFGDVDDPERARRLLMMDQGNRWDFLFMTLYGLFGAAFGVAVARIGSRVGGWIIMSAIVASLADLIETRTLLTLSDEFADQGMLLPGLAYLWLPVTVKFAAIGVSIAAAGAYLMTQHSIIWTALGIATLLVSLALVPALIWPDQLGGLLGLSISVGWIVMLAYAVIRAIREPTPQAEPNR